MDVIKVNKVVPKLRFRGFEDEWKIEPTGHFINLFSGYAFKGDDISDNNKGIPILRGINITEGYIRHSIKIDRYFTGDTSKMEKLFLEVDDLVLGMDGSKVGKNVALITEKDKGSLLIQRVARLRANNQSDIRYIYQQIFSNKFHRYVDVVNTSSGIPHISAKQIKEFKIGFPSLPEQQKIASFLSAVDKKLEQLTKKKELLSAYKKGVMQKIFSKELRFKDNNGNNYPDWEEKKLGEVSDIKKGKQLNKIELTEVGLYPALNGGINPSGYTNKWNTEKDTITISEGGNSCGYVNLSNTRFWCGGHCYSLLDLKDSINFGYLFQILKFSEAHIMRLRVGSGLPNIQMKEIKNFSISIPKIIEQQKIANFLSSLDSKIDLVSTQIENTKAFKKGLLQQMFV